MKRHRRQQLKKELPILLEMYVLHELPLVLLKEILAMSDWFEWLQSTFSQQGRGVQTQNSHEK